MPQMEQVLGQCQMVRQQQVPSQIQLTRSSTLLFDFRLAHDTRTERGAIRSEIDPPQTSGMILRISAMQILAANGGRSFIIKDTHFAKDRRFQGVIITKFLEE